MPDMPESVSKGTILKRLDEFSADPDNVKNLLNLLRGGSSGMVAVQRSNLVDIGTQLGILTNSMERDHLQNDWFTNWWPDAQPVEPIVAMALAAACEEALSRQPHRPFDCYWVCSTGHHDPHHGDHPPAGMPGVVEVAVTWSDRQITILLHTPGGGPPMTGRQLTIPEPIRNVVRNEHGEVEVKQAFHAP